MRCLYCGKELALLKRLTGGGEFCSDSHKQSYQEEYNRLALSRLLQAQAKSGESKARNNQPRDGSPVAVEEPLEEPVRTPEATEVAGFFFDKLTAQVTPDFTPFSEPWIFAATPAAVPEAPEWTYEEEFSPPPFAEQLFSLDIHPTVWQKELPSIQINAVPEEFVAGKVNSDVPLPPTEKLSPNLPAASAIPLQFSTVNCESSRPTTEAPPEEFRFEIVFRSNNLFEMAPTAIDFPAAESELTFGESSVAVALAESPVSESPVDITVPSISDPGNAPGSQGEPVWEEPLATPRAALAALSRLHQNIVDQQEAPIQNPEIAEQAEEPKEEVVRVNVVSPAFARPALEEPEAVEIADQPVVAEPVAEEPMAPEVTETGLESEDIAAPVMDESTEAPPVEVETIAGPEPAAAEAAPPVADMAVAPEAESHPEPEQPPIPREAGDLVAIPLRSFPPVKSHLSMQAAALLVPSHPLRPRLRALPLRPKVAVAPVGFSLPPRTPAAKSPVVETKPVPTASPAAPPAEVRTPNAVKQSQPVPPPQAQPAPASASTAASKPAEAEAARPPKAAAKDSRKPAPKPAPRDDQNRSKNSPSAAAHDEPKLTFEALQLQMMANANPSFWGSLKFKLGLAVLLLGGAIVGYMAIGPSHKPTGGEPNQADAPGPSIMIPNGGWVQDWAGDTIGAHLGREITIYRPSLTLSDYRFQFQAEIETKSVGWVFRASDPNNYYAMKLSIASTALPLKISLLKYLVQNGKETEIGKAPLDLNARADTVYDIRLDVRGSKFYTFVQGQQVDIWKDTELKTGGVGFLNQRGERARIKASTLSYLPGGNK